MKKILIVMLVLSLTLCSFAISEDLDLSVYSDDELKILVDRINKELVERAGFECWFDYGLGQYIPKIQLLSGKDPEIDAFVQNYDNQFYVNVNNVEDGDFENYIMLLNTQGFTEEIKHSRLEYAAHDNKGHRVELTNWGSAGISIKAFPHKSK